IIALISISISLSFGNLSIITYSKVFGQSSLSSTPVQIIKDLTNSYTISSGSSQIGTFHTTYTIIGNMDTIKKEQKLVMSTITGDFNNSPVIGYIKTSMNHTQQQQPTMPNPFADKTTINKKIEAEIGIALSSSTGNSNISKTSIQCDFGMSLSDWRCKSQGLLG
ncbi:MAG TPA: hypothetical protein VGC75_04150, partial [Candidatus Nitrosocosmicus sp.]